MRAREFKILRSILGKTQKDISEMTGSSIRTIQRYEAGETRIPKLLIDHMNNLVKTSKKNYNKKKGL